MSAPGLCLVLSKLPALRMLPLDPRANVPLEKVRCVLFESGETPVPSASRLSANVRALPMVVSPEETFVRLPVRGS